MFPKKIIQPLKVLKCQVISNFNNIISYLTKTKIPQSSNILMNPLFKWDKKKKHKCKIELSNLLQPLKSHH